MRRKISCISQCTFHFIICGEWTTTLTCLTPFSCYLRFSLSYVVLKFNRCYRRQCLMRRSTTFCYFPKFQCKIIYSFVCGNPHPFLFEQKGKDKSKEKKMYCNKRQESLNETTIHFGRRVYERKVYIWCRSSSQKKEEKRHFCWGWAGWLLNIIRYMRRCILLCAAVDRQQTRWDNLFAISRIKYHFIDFRYHA